MTAWKVVSKSAGTIGSSVVMACVSCEKGYVNLTGKSDAVEELLFALESIGTDSKSDTESNEYSLVRFVFVNKDGAASAMAFECSTVDGMLTLQTLEQIENFASNKLDQSVLAETWSVMAKTPKVFEPVGDDIVGGVKCENTDQLDPGDENDFVHTKQV